MLVSKFTWRLVDKNGREHKHKFFQDSIQENPVGIRRRVVDVAAVTDVAEARNLLASGWEYKTSSFYISYRSEVRCHFIKSSRGSTSTS
jgi:hypothetical protein